MSAQDYDEASTKAALKLAETMYEEAATRLQECCALAFDLGRENEQLADGVRTLGAENARLSAATPIISGIEEYHAIVNGDLKAQLAQADATMRAAKEEIEAGTREIADLRAEAARCANAETIANGKLALAEAELRDAKATITKLGNEMRDLRDRFQAERARRFELEREAVTAEEAHRRKYGGIDFLLDGIGDLEDKARLLLTEYNLTFADKEPPR